MFNLHNFQEIYANTTPTYNHKANCCFVELKCDFNTLNLTYNTLIFSKFSINTRPPVATEQRLSYVCEICLDKFVQVFKGLIV